MRKYELAFIVDPRVPDEDVVSLGDEYKKLLETQGARVTKEESWGKRKLAYPIRKFTEGKYLLFLVENDGGNPFREVEQRLQQNENVLRYLTVRTDAGRLKAPAEEPAVENAGGEG